MILMMNETEYKLLKEFDEIVPGMIFECFECLNNNMIIIDVQRDIIIHTFREMNGLSSRINKLDFSCHYKLIHDPRNDEDVLKKEIIKKECELATLKEKLNKLNSFELVEGELYKITFHLGSYRIGLVYKERQNFKLVSFVDQLSFKTDLKTDSNAHRIYVKQFYDKPSEQYPITSIQKILNNPSPKDLYEQINLEFGPNLLKTP